MRTQNQLIETLMSTLKSTNASDMLPKVNTLLDEKKHLEKEVVELRQKVALAASNPSSGANETQTINGVSFIGKVLADTPAKELKPLVDAFKKKIGSGVIALISTFEGKVSIVVGVTNDLTDKYNAVEIVRAVSPIVGGQGGGGRPDMAQAGGSDATQATAALQKVEALL